MNRFDRLFWSRLWTLTRPYCVSEQRFGAFGLLTLTLLLSGSILAASVVFSYVARDMMTALADRNAPTFIYKMALVVGYNLVSAPVVALSG